MVIEIGIKNLDVSNDSKLVINQLLEDFGVKKDNLISYHKHALRMLVRLETIKLEHTLIVIIG